MLSTKQNNAYVDPVESIPRILLLTWSSILMALLLLTGFVVWSGNHRTTLTEGRSMRYQRGRGVSEAQHEALVQRGRQILRSAAD